jgi:flavin reductase (DIM6/NTAB) family NADH-FMN oxidoreductase RutF
MTASAPTFDSAFFRATLGRFPTGVAVITASLPGQAPVGLTVSSFNSVSLEPPLVLFSLSRGSSSMATMQDCDRYVIHVMSHEQLGVSHRFTRGTPAERFANMPLVKAPGGSPRLDLPCRC